MERSWMKMQYGNALRAVNGGLRKLAIPLLYGRPPFLLVSDETAERIGGMLARGGVELSHASKLRMGVGVIDGEAAGALFVHALATYGLGIPWTGDLLSWRALAHGLAEALGASSMLHWPGETAFRWGAPVSDYPINGYSRSTKGDA